ncbi:hypothetical protein F0U44_04270 [Nocardioides humilatus]|uniref:Uncharacterized protein n=1 Tax=Nocardioides humilatus TaxID=2607660 RepID=A0A5B1LLC7_9ACTN|nr:hypothetical protein [Nocardioides humilatus]KAA1421512.1 hypothetical protein F0U44_04270 [Nocardioides humilatus]
MGELDEIDFGADTDSIRRWLAKRATYANELGDPDGGARHRVDPPSTVDPLSLAVPNARDAGQDVLEALIAPTPPIATRWPTPYKKAEPVVEPAGEEQVKAVHANPPPRTGTTPGHRSPYASTPEHEEELTSSRSTNAVFKPRNWPHHMTTVILVAVAAATALTGYQAYLDRTTMAYGLAALCGLLLIIVWAVRATTSVTEMAVIRGQLEIIHNGKFEIVDLASPYTPVLVEGRPGHRGWKVLIERHDQPLLILDKSMVDPRIFMAVLERLRPDLREPAAPTAQPAP